jgi:hypothetical protein
MLFLMRQHSTNFPPNPLRFPFLCFAINSLSLSRAAQPAQIGFQIGKALAWSTSMVELFTQKKGRSLALVLLLTALAAFA